MLAAAARPTILNLNEGNGPMLYAIQCVDAKGGLTNCAIRHLAPHKRILVGQKHILVVGGALFSEGTEELLGSLYIVNVANRKAAGGLLEERSLHTGGSLGTVTITAMRKSHWNPASA